jgi:hypothetical protein
MSQPSFKNSRRALKAHEALKRRSERELNMLMDRADLGQKEFLALWNKWLKRRTVGEDVVRRAFFEDTKHVNSLDNCMLVDLGFIEQLAAKYP